MNKYDVIIIGAGLGGLTTGATLAKAGKKVLVLEQHFIPGGAATIFERKGVKFEVGLHEMDWGTPDRDMKHHIFKKLGILESLPIIPIPQAWSVKTETQEYVIPHGRKNVIEYLSKKFPEDAKGIKKYFADMKYTIINNEKFPHDMNFFEFLIYPIYKFPSVLRNIFQQANVGDKLDKYIKSNKLKNILNANIVYYSDKPYELSWDYHSAAQYNYYNSAVFIKGGSQVLSNQLVDIITKNNGEIRLLADVQKIELEGNKAVGVTYQDRKTKENITVYGGKIIANCAPNNIFDGKMVPAEFSEPKIEKLEPACSLWTIYIIFKEAMHKKFPNLAYSTFLMSDKRIEKEQGEITNTVYGKDGQTRGMVLVDYSTIDSGLVPEGDPRGFGVLCGASTMDEWQGSTEEYKAKKEKFTQELFDSAEKLYPGFKENIEYYELSTPKTVQRYLKTPNGTAYGYKNQGYLLGNRGPREASQIKNLHFTGAWTFPGGGFTGAIISGYATAQNILFGFKHLLIVRTLWTTAVCTTVSLLIKKFILGH